MNVKEWSSGDVTIKIDYDECIGSSECADGCPSNVYEMKDGKAAAVNIADCIQCGACVQACIQSAISHSAF
ncbi:MAG: ferredoxin [Acidobacteria bacterium]|jgi:NAD-dependent dihydropyrimidine dehydrogenase PreA subunit|nr:ferredoxin [Acidobacteriota bacterium]